jgi:PIN domain nuclease of toxin-antitoxin system
VILLDTHAWIWWVSDPDRLSGAQRDLLTGAEQGSIAVSAISVWEVARLVEYRRLDLDRDTLEWLREALSTILMLPITPEIAVESSGLPGTFHRDPADQIIVATARISDCLLVTSDRKITAYPHVNCVA